MKKDIAYDGYCAFAVSVGKTHEPGSAHELTVDGKTYLFSNPTAKFLFKVLPNRIAKADAHWNKK